MTNTGTRLIAQLCAIIEEKEQPLPLKHTEVKAKIVGNISRVEVKQTFENPYTKPLEAIYVFPLPDEAAVDQMEIKIGDRLIKGNIKKKEEAQEIYQQAKKQGRTAGLLQQQRDNIFRQSLANIKPGEQIDILIRYTDSLKFFGGNYEFIFPTVVGPRYIPGTPIDESGDTDQVPDASQITPPIMPPDTRSGHDINITLEIEAGVAITEVTSPSHQIQTQKESHILKIELDQLDTIPNKDFIVRYKVAGQETQSTILTQADEKGGHFAAYLIPAVEYSREKIVPKDVVFLIDTSGSQAGDPLEQCLKLMRKFIEGLNTQDTFSIIDFANTTRKLSEHPLTNTPENRQKAIKYINQLRADGGTELLRGIKEVLKFPPASEGRLRSIVLLTDGYIGNEKEIIAEVQQKLEAGNRLYSFGAGSSVNRFFINRIAEVGRGIAEIIRQDEPIDKTVENFFQRINNPVLTNIQLIWQGAGETPTIYPQSPPDLFAKQPLVLYGRKSDFASGNLKILGSAAGGEVYEKTFELTFEEKGNRGIAQLWGRAKIKDLTNQMYQYETKTGVEEITETALSYQLLSQYTAFIAVSDDLRVDPQDYSLQMEIPVEMPQSLILNAPLAAYERIAAPSSMDTFDDDDFTLEQLRGFIYPLSSRKSLALQIKVVTVTGLSEQAINSLRRHLHKLKLPAGFNGRIIFEFQTKNNRVQNVRLDEKLSTITDTALVKLIERSLITWLPPSSENTEVILTLKIQT